MYIKYININIYIYIYIYIYMCVYVFVYVCVFLDPTFFFHINKFFQGWG